MEIQRTHHKRLLALSAALAVCCLTVAAAGQDGAAKPRADLPARLTEGSVAKKPVEFKDGDRVVLIGTTVFERDQRHAWLEAMLTLAVGDKKVTVRNLAWSGDTVFGHARSYFGPPEEGLQRLGGHLDLVKPTVAILCYGADLAFEGLGGLPDFLTGYRKLLDLIRAKAPGVRVVIVTPPPVESLPPPLPDLAQANRNLSSLRDALQKFAMMQNAGFVDWFEELGGIPGEGRVAKGLTENGIHFHDAGYEKAAQALVRGLGLKPAAVKGKNLDALRAAIRRKDELFFNRWRPQNETYLFGFRKHEQGQNAAEIPQFDPLVEEADGKVQALKRELLEEPPRL
jgi:lysophospholipase L1-like esterase